MSEIPATSIHSSRLSFSYPIWRTNSLIQTSLTSTLHKSSSLEVKTHVTKKKNSNWRMSCRNCKGSSKVHIWPNTCRNWWFSWCLRIRSTLIPHLFWTVSLTTSATDTKWASSKTWLSTSSTSWSASKKAYRRFLQIWTSMSVYLNIWREANRKRMAIIHMSRFWILLSQPW